MISDGIRTFQASVWPQALISQLGMSRSAPSSQPMYQSGCEPAVIWSGCTARTSTPG